MATEFLQQVQSVMQGRFQSDPVLAENVVSVDVTGTRFMVVTHIPIPSETGYDSHYMFIDAMRDEYDTPRILLMRYAHGEDSETERTVILDYIINVGENLAA